MNRIEFHKLFKSPGPVVTPVVHVLDTSQAMRAVETVVRAGAAGVFLINHDFEEERLLPIIQEVRAEMPSLWLGVNFLAVTGREAFPMLGALENDGCMVDAYWADNARMDEREAVQREADDIADIRAASGWSGMYFGGTAFKAQRPVAPSQYQRSAEIALPYMDVVTTSGPATGLEADETKIDDFRRGIGDAPLALASGITPENAARYGREVDCFLVATGIAPPGDFYSIDLARLNALLDVTRELGAKP